MQQQYFNFEAEKEAVKISEKIELELVAIMVKAILEADGKEQKNGDKTNEDNYKSFTT
ncbi:hypothetical protein [Candidatus Uabimicrobium amorphum]|uniref:Uncharacterized protein n=1 Tax=Uabimicrobium amorphum TaxID=2596890 RepID=A0A5S9F5I5_UABAM|nr:hypothetical protein [Candidatus Uabimicrobium amorphum]BBM86341.1 hypothetical protein UABAM_04727 [Candidatus Uabimicrobium amorphum]